ncbi:phosphatases ii [Ceraceosorus bombacis]|uniref:protein-tyrosine-phosphatase n=1 Tax=Ceraceosorus bombacis TaxID=401625 RepID=A0A0N7L8V5_9BASI|nr:phosphatases ii [Ceraceosorus bombacis]
MTPILSFTWFDKDRMPTPRECQADNGRNCVAMPEDRKAEREQKKFQWLSIDVDLGYLSFYKDWGPLNMAMFYRFCLHVACMHLDPDEDHLVLYTSSDPHNKANAALLAAMYAMVIERLSPCDAFHPLAELEFEPFRDAGYGRADFCLTIQDVLYGFHKARECDVLQLENFNLDEYEWYERVENGDWNWITPNIIAFASPNDKGWESGLKLPPAEREKRTNAAFTRSIKYFKQHSVGAVVRLNNPLYDREAYERVGIEHYDMYFDDGSNPSDQILRAFIKLADETVNKGKVIAVHCKAGLGRTGVLIGAYLIWKHGFTAQEVIGFMRIMRPGCVVGPQQRFMYENFVEWIRWSTRDIALKEAREAIEAEKEALKKQGFVEGRKSRKRGAEDEADDTSTSTEEREERAVDGLVTPRAKRTLAEVPSSVAPAIKPTPCVGQPRKSPKSTRKRQATALRHVPSIGALTHDTRTKSLPDPAEAEAAKSTAAPVTGFMPRSVSDESLKALAENISNHSGKAPPTPGPSVRLEAAGTGMRGGTPPLAPSTPGRVLGEAHRINMQAGHGGVVPMGLSTPPNPSGSFTKIKAATVGRPVRTHHERSQSTIAAPTFMVDDVFTDAPPSAHAFAPPSPSAGGARTASARIPTFRASPQIKTKYGLRDTSKDHASGSSIEAEDGARSKTSSADGAGNGIVDRVGSSQTSETSASSRASAQRSASGSSARRQKMSGATRIPSGSSRTRTNGTAQLSRLYGPTVASLARSRGAEAPDSSSSSRASSAASLTASPQLSASSRSASRTPSAVNGAVRLGRVRPRRSSFSDADLQV